MSPWRFLVRNHSARAVLHWPLAAPELAGTSRFSLSSSASHSHGKFLIWWPRMSASMTMKKPYPTMKPRPK